MPWTETVGYSSEHSSFLILFLSYICFFGCFFLSWFSLTEHSGIKVKQEKRETISNSSLPLQPPPQADIKDISRAITVESSPQQIAGGRTPTKNPWLLSFSLSVFLFRNLFSFSRLCCDIARRDINLINYTVV